MSFKNNEFREIFIHIDCVTAYRGAKLCLSKRKVGIVPLLLLMHTTFSDVTFYNNCYYFNKIDETFGNILLTSQKRCALPCMDWKERIQNDFT